MNKNIGCMNESELKDFIIGLNDQLSRCERSIHKTIIYLEEHYLYANNDNKTEKFFEDYDIATIYEMLKGEDNE